MDEQPQTTKARSPITHLRNAAFLATGVLLATSTSSAITSDGAGPLALAVVLITALNTFIRPLFVLLALPFVVFTLGLGMLIINALLFWAVGSLDFGFRVDGFGPALWGALVISLVQLVCHLFFTPPQGPRIVIQTRSSSPSQSRQKRNSDEDDDDNVIDI